MNDSQQKLLLSPAEAASRLGVGRNKIYEMASSGEIPVIRIGKSVKFTPDSLTEWIKTKLASRVA